LAARPNATELPDRPSTTTLDWPSKLAGCGDHDVGLPHLVSQIPCSGVGDRNGAVRAEQ
jgi:hypothetical protein